VGTGFYGENRRSFKDYRLTPRNRSEPDDQNKAFESKNFELANKEAQDATARVLQRVDLIKAVGQGGHSEPLLREKSEMAEAPPGYAESAFPALPEDHAISGASGAPDAKGKGKETSQGFLSGLSQAFSAVTAAMRPKPDPFVIPLCEAAKRADHGQIRGFLQQGVNINGRNEEGQTALTCAITALHHDTVQFLINSGADVSVKDSKSKLPLFKATQTGDIAMAKLLLRNGANPNERSMSGRPYFVDAAMEMDLAMMRLLLESGVDPKMRDLNGRSLLIMAVLAKKLPMMELLVEKGADVNSRDITGRSALTIAILDDRIDIVKFLLDHGANGNERDITGQAMIIYASDKGNTALVKMLLQHGADPNVRDLLGRPLFSEIIKNDKSMDMTQAFLDHGVNLKGLTVDGALSSGGCPPLLWAILRENWELAKLLIKHGADSNATDGAGRTPLLETMQRDNEQLVQLLLRHGADPNKEAKISPFAFARGTNRTDLMKLLKRHGAQGTIPASASLRSNPRIASQQQDASTLSDEGSSSPASSRQNRVVPDAPPDYDSIR